MLDEVSSYDSIENIESLIEEKNSLEHVPVQPLYMAYLKLPKEKKTLYLEKLSHEQRQSCLLYTSPSPRDATLSRMPSSA